jgi:hypothetical protein
MPSRHVHLVGSVPLADATTVFTTASEALGPRLKRIPDGETGERSDWIAHLEAVFANNPALEKSDEIFRLHATAPGRTRYRLKPGKTPADVRFNNLLYADTAIRSYGEFARLKRQGVIPAQCRFQVDLVPAHSVRQAGQVGQAGRTPPLSRMSRMSRFPKGGRTTTTYSIPTRWRCSMPTSVARHERYD